MQEEDSDEWCDDDFGCGDFGGEWKRKKREVATKVATKVAREVATKVVREVAKEGKRKMERALGEMTFAEVF